MRALLMAGALLGGVAGGAGCARVAVVESSRRAVEVVDVSFSEGGRWYDARLLVPSRANGGAALLLAGGSVSDMHWTVPGSAEIDGRTVVFTRTGSEVRDGDALAAGLLARGFHVMQWSSIHRDDPKWRENPAFAEGLAYESVRGLARRALGVLLEHERTRGMPVVLVGQSLGAARALQIAAGREEVAAMVFVSGAYVSPLAEAPSRAGVELVERHGLEVPVAVGALDGRSALLEELGVGGASALDVDGDGTVWRWELASRGAVASLERGDRSVLGGEMLAGERHPGWLVLESRVPVLAVFGGEDAVSVHGPVLGWLAEESGRSGAGGIEVRFERGLGHGLGVVEPPPARDAGVIQAVVGPIDGRVVERVSAWAAARVGVGR